MGKNCFNLTGLPEALTDFASSAQHLYKKGKNFNSPKIKYYSLTAVKAENRSLTNISNKLIRQE